MQLPTPDTTQAGLVGLDGWKAEINTNQYLHYFDAGIIVPHQFLMHFVAQAEDTREPDCCKLEFCPIMALAGQSGYYKLLPAGSNHICNLEHAVSLSLLHSHTCIIYEANMRHI